MVSYTLRFIISKKGASGFCFQASRFRTSACALTPLLEGRTPYGPTHVYLYVGRIFHNIINRGHCLGTLLQQCEQRSHCYNYDLGSHYLDTIAAFLILLVSLLTSSPEMWRKEHIWNFRVLQRVHLSILLQVVDCYRFATRGCQKWRDGAG